MLMCAGGWGCKQGEVPQGAKPYHKLPIFNYHEVIRPVSGSSCVLQLMAFAGWCAGYASIFILQFQLRNCCDDLPKR